MEAPLTEGGRGRHPGQIAEAHHLEAPLTEGGRGRHPGQIAEAHHLEAPLTEGGRGRHPGQELKARHPFTSAGRFVGSFPPLSTLLQGAAGDGLPA